MTRWRILWRRACLAVLAGLLSAAAAGGQQASRTMLVHLPSAPVASAGRQAEAVNALTDSLAGVLPGVPLETKIFRRLEDAQTFLEANGDTVVLALSDAALVDDLPAGLEPAFRFVRQGRATYRRLVVVRDDRSEFQKLADLKGLSLTVVETAGRGSEEFLERQVFAGALDPGGWFREIEPAADDFAATVRVLYGQTDAALVAEYNPLLAEHLSGGELRVLYESPPLSLPVLSVRESAFDAEQRRALDRALRGMTGASSQLAALGLDGLEALPDRRALVTIPETDRKRLALAAPSAGAIPWSPVPLPDPEDLPFLLAIEIPEVTIDPAAVAAGSSPSPER